MFFLGCSLEKDRTMDILQDTIIHGVNHYAIIGCKKSEKDEKARKLGEKYIRAILYEQGRHEAVRVILEHLLEETRTDIYQKICPVGALKPHSPSDRFYYDAGIVPLSGRKKELGELNSFLQTPAMPFQWWAITGPGGCGKSRLAYEFQNQLPLGWLARYLKQSDYKNLHGMTSNLTQKTLLIADYVQEHARELGEWMESLNEQPRSLPIRLLLVERETGRGSEDSAWTKQLYSDVHNEIKLKETCYRKAFLRLSPLSDQDLLNIMENYVAAMQGNKWKTSRILTNKKKQILLQKLKAIDPDLCRPLYAMFLADAYVDSNDIEQWKREDILDYVISRERKRLQFSIRNVMHTDIMDQKLYNACIYLQCAATVLQDVPVKKLQEFFPDIWKIIEDRSVYFESPVDFMYQIGLVITDELPALRPDLVGEYFVYDWLFQNRENTIQDFILAIWKIPVRTGVFYQRLFDDFNFLLNDFPERWDILFPDNIYFSKNTLLVYATLVSTATFYCNRVVQCEKFVDSLEKFIISYPNKSEIVDVFAKGLVNLSSKQDVQGAKKTVWRLEKLFREHSDKSEIAAEFARGLVNLSNKQDVQGAKKAVWRLEKLSREHPNNFEIVDAFAQGLVNLSNKQDVQGAKKIVWRLEKLSREHPDDPKIVVRFASGLVNLIGKQDKQGAEKNVWRLEKLAFSCSDLIEITAKFASGLSSLSSKQGEQGAKKTVERLKKLAFSYPEVTEIVTAFASGLFNLSCKQDEFGANRTVGHLEKLSNEHPNKPEIVNIFAKGLVNLSVKQNEQDAQKTVGRLEKLASNYPDAIEIVSAFANGMSNLSNKQNEQDAEKTIGCLEKLTFVYPNVMEIVVAFANALVNLNCKQDVRGVEKTVRLLEKLSNEHPNKPELAAAFANGLANLSCIQDEQGAKKTVECLEKLASDYSDVTEITAEFARGLVNLSCIQDEQGAKKTMKRLEILITKSPDAFFLF